VTHVLAAGTNADVIARETIFWILAVLAVGAALAMILVRRAVHCAIMLAVVMLCLATMYAMQGAPFLAFVQIIVYTGAVLMLVLFVLMLIGIRTADSVVETIKGQRLAAGLAATGFFVILILGIGHAALGPATRPTAANGTSNLSGIATLIFTRYVFPFEATGALLITAALGAMMLAHRERAVPRPTQRDLAAQRLASGQLAPDPPSGVYALHDAADRLALLPDGSTSDASVSPVLSQRAESGRPEGVAMALNLRSLATLSAGAIGGVAAFGLALQATGTWHPTNTQAATAVALATLSVSILTVRGGIERFDTDIRWRRGYPLALSIVTAAGSVLATTGLALLAGQVIRLGPLARGALVVTAAITALASSIMNTYTDERIARNHEDQKRLNSAMDRLFAKASDSTMLWNRQDLEVVLFVKALNIFHRARQPLRLVQTVCTGSPRPHPRIIHGPPTDPIWRCYTNGNAVTGEVEMEIVNVPSLLRPGPIRWRPGVADFKLIYRSKRQHSVWAHPLKNEANEVIGVIAVQIHSNFTTNDILPFEVELAVCANTVAEILGSG
jgi:NADH-quinone oxidoreductase subunit J